MDQERKKTQINPMRNVTGNIITDPEDIKTIIKGIQLYTHKFNNWEGMAHQATHYHNSSNKK